MYKIDIKKRVDDKFQTMNQFATEAKISHKSAENIYKGITTRISFDVLESLCELFNCTPNDLIVKNVNDKFIPISQLDSSYKPEIFETHSIVNKEQPETNLQTTKMSDIQEDLIKNITIFNAQISQAISVRDSYIRALDLFSGKSDLARQIIENNLKSDYGDAK